MCDMLNLRNESFWADRKQTFDKRGDLHTVCTCRNGSIRDEKNIHKIMKKNEERSNIMVC